MSAQDNLLAPHDVDALGKALGHFLLVVGRSFPYKPAVDAVDVGEWEFVDFGFMDGRLHGVHQVLASILVGRNLEERVAVDAVDVNCLRAATAGAEYEIHLVGGTVDVVGLLEPVSAFDADRGGHFVARPGRVGG